MHYYTYAYLREDRTPYYIGKGTGKRIYSTNKRIKPPKDKSRIIFLKKNITEEESFKHEIYMIDVFGRKDLGTGILHNRTDGGEGASGSIRSDEHKRKISDANKNPSEETRIKIGAANKGKTRSEETIKKMREASKNPSEETRKKMSEAHKGKTLSEETRKKLSEAHKGNTYCLGKTLSEETRRKIGDASKGRTHMKGKTLSEETRKKLSEVRKGKKWWNDGCGNRKRMIECPGDGWKPGRK